MEIKDLNRGSWPFTIDNDSLYSSLLNYIDIAEYQWTSHQGADFGSGLDCGEKY
jgi:hypothetical protein